MRILAAVVEREGGPFVLEELELDKPRSDEVVVRVVASGICQTDLHVRDQYYPVPLPAVLGHEGAGIVESVGDQVRSVEHGDHVVLSFQSCGICLRCVGGHRAYCERGFEANFAGARLDGTNALHRTGPSSLRPEVHGHFFGQSSFATHALATERNVVKVPFDAPIELLGPLGCSVQTGAGAVLNALCVRSGSSIAVFGTGPVGLSAVMAARVAGADPIIGVDVIAPRLELASDLGATHTIDANREDVAVRINEITGSGVDYVLEMSARPHMLKLAVDVLAPLGTAALIGSARTGTEAPIDMNTLQAGRNLRGIVQGDSSPQSFIPELVRMYTTGELPFDRFVRPYDFTEINDAVADMESGVTAKPILRIAEP